MTNLQRRPIVQGERLYVRKTINWGGRVYPSGEEFSYRHMAISWRDVIKLRGAGKLMGADELELSNIKASPTEETKDLLLEESKVEPEKEYTPQVRRKKRIHEEEPEEKDTPKRRRKR